MPGGRLLNRPRLRPRLLREPFVENEDFCDSSHSPATRAASGVQNPCPKSTSQTAAVLGCETVGCRPDVSPTTDPPGRSLRLAQGDLGSAIGPQLGDRLCPPGLGEGPGLIACLLSFVGWVDGWAGGV